MMFVLSGFKGSVISALIHINSKIMMGGMTENTASDTIILLFTTSNPAALATSAIFFLVLAL